MDKSLDFRGCVGGWIVWRERKAVGVRWGQVVCKLFNDGFIVGTLQGRDGGVGRLVLLPPGF